VSIVQEATQNNGNDDLITPTLGIAQSQEAGDGTITQTATANQSNTSTQNANGNSANATAKDVSVTSTGNVEAGGDGVVGQSIANADVHIVQKTIQSNVSGQSQAAGTGAITQTATANQSNTSTQNANNNSANATSGAVNVSNTGNVTAGGNGVVGRSIATAEVKIDRKQQPLNAASISQLAGGAATITPSITQTQNNSGNSVSATSGPVSVTSVGNITAGGNGMVVGSSASASSTVNVVDPAVAGDVIANSQGNISAGENGVIAASLASSSAGGNATTGNVTVDVHGDITAGKMGILASSIAEIGGVGGDPSKQGKITVSVDGGTVTGGDGFYGVAILGGNNNELDNSVSGVITSLSKQAILNGSTGTLTLNNLGLIDGSIDKTTDAGLTNFNNFAGAEFDSGKIINLGGGELWNEGVLSPGGPGSIQTSNLTGDLYQGGKGVLVVDLDAQAGVSDKILVSGEAEMSGKVQPIIDRLGVDPKQFMIVSAQEPSTYQGMTLTNIPQSVVGDVNLSLWWTSKGILLDYSLTNVNFTPQGLNSPNQTAVGNNLNANYVGDPSPGVKNTLNAAANASTSLNSYTAALDQLSGSQFAQELQSVLWSLRPINELITDRMDCSLNQQVVGPTRYGNDQALTRGPINCFTPGKFQMWARAQGVWNHDSGDINAPGFDEQEWGVWGGGDYALNGSPIFLGVAGGFFSSNMDFDKFGGARGANIDYSGGQVAGYAGWDNSIWYNRGIVSAGFYDGTSHRNFTFTSPINGHPDSDVVSFYDEAGRRFAIGTNVTMTPFAGVTVANAQLDGFTETDTANSGAALKISDSNGDSLVSTVGLRFNGTWGAFRPDAAVAWEHEFDDTFQTVHARFASSTSNNKFRVIGTELGADAVVVDAGASYALGPQNDLSVRYIGRFLSDFDSNSVSGRWTYKFY
jgi:trimeric autotransporter adhesin